MIKYLCFRPKYIEGTNTRRVTIENHNSVNSYGLKRRWQILPECNHKDQEKIKRLVAEIVKNEKSSIYSLGVRMDLLSLCSFTFDERCNMNVFYIVSSSIINLIQNNTVEYERLMDLTKSMKVFIENDEGDKKYQKTLKSLNLKGNSNVLIESCYSKDIDDFELGDNIYLDYCKLKRKDYLHDMKFQKYFISTSYSDSMWDVDFSSTITNWEKFRSSGFYELIYFLRSAGLSEQEIVSSIYGKFITLFDTKGK